MSYADSHPGAGYGARSTGVDRSDSSGASSARNSGVGGVGSQMSQNRDGSLSMTRGGVTAAPAVRLSRVGIPRPAAMPLMAPVALPPQVSIPTPTNPLTGAPPYRVDLNPATLASWRGVGLRPASPFSNANGNYPAQFNGGGPGRTFGLGPKDQSRHPGMGGTAGHAGGGYGGGGGGGR